IPPKSDISSKTAVEQEGRILLAIESIQKDQVASIREAAHVFNIPRTTLRARLAGRGFVKDMVRPSRIA
ncbi:hypothetical protein ASPBRDRAFT_139700, partial [Aspergillus brasiliensis CBS 101740]